MKVELGKQDLEKYGGLTEKISGKNAAFPILSTIRIEARKNYITLRATNLEIGIEVTIPAKVASEGIAVVSASTFFQMLRSEGKTGIIGLETKDGSLYVRSGTGEVRLKTYPEEEFPTIPTLDERGAARIQAEDFLKGLRAVWYAASTSLIKPELASVYLYQEQNALVFVATDSFRLGEKMVPLKGKTDITSFLIPSRNIPEIIRVLEQASGEIEVRSTEHQISFVFEQVYLTSRLVQGSFPDYRQIIPKGQTTEVILLREDLVQALRRTNIFSDKFNQIRFTIQPKKKKCILFAKNDEVGEITENLEASLSGDDLEISFNTRYLTDCFQSINSDSVSLSFSGFGKPLVIRGISDSSFLYLVMPMNR